MLTETQGPQITTDTEVFWNGLREHKMLLQTCSNCSKHRWPPGPMCPYCGSLESSWLPGPNEGELYSWTIAHHPANPSLASQVPYALVLVELAEGVRVVGNLVDYDGEELRAGERLRLLFEEREDGVVIYNFARPNDAGGEAPAVDHTRSDGNE